jgi:hypothetical protein
MAGICGESMGFSRVGRLRRTRRSPRLLLWAALLVLVPAGCIGPRSLELTRLRYDQAVHETTDQQWLRNIVRLRYGDLPSFMDVAAITSQFELSSSGGFTGGKQRDSANNTYFGDMSVQFRDAPTLSYTPRDPTELTRTMVAPVGITALGLMANNGWSLDDVLRVIVADVNGLENSPGAEQLIPEIIPSATPFDEMARLAGQLRRGRMITLAAVDLPKPVSSPIAANRVDGSDLVQAASNKLEYRAAEKTDELVLTRSDPGYLFTFSPVVQGRPDVDAFRQALRLAPGRLEYGVRRVDAPVGSELLPLPGVLDTIDVKTRTLLDMLTFLSKGIDVPEEHLCRGLAAQTIGPDGIAFDWTVVTRNLFHICSQRTRPKESAVAIEYQGYWYYIPASDKRSKSTLSLIQALFNLQLSEPKKSGPLLTLPVGG